MFWYFAFFLLRSYSFSVLTPPVANNSTTISPPSTRAFSFLRVNVPVASLPINEYDGAVTPECTTEPQQAYALAPFKVKIPFLHDFALNLFSRHFRWI